MKISSGSGRLPRRCHRGAGGKVPVVDDLEECRDLEDADPEQDRQGAGDGADGDRSDVSRRRSIQIQAEL